MTSAHASAAVRTLSAGRCPMIV